MQRFVGLVWNPADHAETAASRVASSALQADAEVWRTVFSDKGVRVFATSSSALEPESLQLGNNAGVILGSLFKQPTRSEDTCGSSLRCLAAEEIRLVVESDGRSLVERFWGSYVAFIRNGARGTTCVLRGPRAFLPCFSTVFRGVRLYFSRTEDCVGLDLIGFSADWRKVAFCAAYGSGGTRGPAINEISELKPGECLEHGGGGIVARRYWDAASIAQSGVIDDVAAATRQARWAVRTCAHAWTSRHKIVAHRLSGGLDSSVVASCLGTAPSKPLVICLNDYSSGSNGDERKFARAVANHTGFELIEKERRTDFSFEEMMTARRTAVPPVYYLELACDRPALRVARQRCATAIFTGAQGDATFYVLPARLAAADYIWNRGIGFGLFRTALDAAQLERASFWRVLANALSMGFKRSAQDYWTIQREFLNENPGRSVVNMELANLLAEDEHLADPEFPADSRCPPGKLWHIFEMTGASAYEDPFSDPSDPEIVHPMMSQPVAEVCLRIPTYTHLTGGWDRAISRRAFAEDLPPNIVGRTSKGGIEEHAKLMTMRNIDFVRQLLLDGLLVKERVLNRIILEDALSGRPTKSTVTAAMLLIYLGIEVWLSLWRRTKCPMA